MDFLNDQSGRHLLRIDEIVSAPDYVKQASIDPETITSLPLNCFADQARKEFPLNTPANVFLSYGYYKSANMHQPAVAARLKKAAAKFNIAQDLDSIDAAFAQAGAQVKQASAGPERQYAIQLDFTGAEKAAATGVQGFYPINDTDQIQDSAVQLDNDKNQLPLSLYVTGAREIVKAAAAVGLEDRLLPGRIRLYGTEHFPDFTYIQREAERRATLTGDDAYLEITKAASVNEDQRDMDDYIQLWELADASNGVKYAASTPDPYRLFNTGESKRAYEQTLEAHTVLSGAVVPVAALASLDVDALKKVFPKEAHEAVSGVVKLAAAAEPGAVLTASIGDLTPAIQKRLLETVLTAVE